MGMLVVGLSGPSSSGKSTLARQLQRALPQAVVIYEDDFYLTDKDIPYKNGFQNWDTPDAFDLKKLQQVLNHAKQTKTLPSEFVSLEEKNDIGQTQASQETIDKAKQKLTGFNDTVIIIDGIMLYQKESPVIDEFDLKLLIPGEYSVLKQRREARKGYATVEGFWTDPPGYYDQIVWPEYVEHYGYLLDGDKLSQDAKKLNIQIPSALDIDSLIDWAVDRILTLN